MTESHHATTIAPPIAAQQGAHVWRGGELARGSDWIVNFTASEADEALSALAQARATGKPLEELRRGDFALARLAPKFHAIARELEWGRGFVLARGMDISSLSDDECKTLFWGLGLQLGAPLCQSRLNNYIAEVKNIGEVMGQATTRAYRAGGPLRFHTDQCDVLALMCVREALSGGHSRVVSSAAIHNAIRERRPDLLQVLCEPYYFSRQGEEYGSELPWYARPVFDSEAGRFTSIFTRSYIESAQRMPEVPRLTPQQQEAIELVSALADELSVTIELRRGDMQFFNNHLVYHSRTDYQDHEAVEMRRTQLRLWLASPVSRPLPDDAAVLFGTSEGGALRGGVTPPSGRRFAFADWSDAGWSSADLRAFRELHAA